MDPQNVATATAKRVVRDRSPAYPFISLRVAMERLAAFEKKFGRHPTPADKAGLAWGMKEKSSQAFQTLAALKSFGLVTYEGANEQRVASLTDEGRNYLRAQQEAVKAAIVKQSALRPKSIRTYWSRWGADRPIDEVCLDQLTLQDGFTDSAAATFLKVYDDTVAFAGLTNGDSVSDVPPPATNPAGAGPQDEPALPTMPKLGDIVRWESGGVIQFNARRVRGVAPDGSHVFVEGSSTGLPTKEVTVIPQGDTPPATVIQPAASMQIIGTKQDTFTLDEGAVVLQWPSHLSETSYEDFKDWIELQLRKIKRSIQ